MNEAAQRIIDAQRIEQRERQLPSWCGGPGTVGDLIADCRKQGARKVVGEFLGGNAAVTQLVALVENVGVGDFLTAHGNGNFGPVVGDEVAQLLGQVVAEGGWLRDGRGVDAGALELCIGAGDRWLWSIGSVGDAKLGIAEAGAHFRRRRRARLHEPLERRLQAAGGLVVEHDQLFHCLLGREGGRMDNGTVHGSGAAAFPRASGQGMANGFELL